MNSKNLKVAAALVIFALGLIFPAELFTQPSALWVKYYNNFLANKNDNAAKSVIDNNGNIYVTGTSMTNTASDILTIKYDAAGNMKWVRIFNNAQVDGYDLAQDMCVDPLGNVYITGQTSGTNSTLDGLVLKYDSTGTLKWSRYFNRTNIAERKAYGLRIICYPNIYISCTFVYGNNSECGVLRLTQNGDSVGYRVLAAQSGQGVAFMRGLDADNLGNIYASCYGIFDANEGYDMAYFKINSSLVTEWSKFYKGASNNDDLAYDFKIGPDGNLFLCGSSFQNNQGSDFMLLKIGRDDGAVLWSKRINNPEANQSDYGGKIAFDNNANIIVAGASDGLNTAADLFTVKFSPTGTILWQQRYNYNTTREDRFSDLICDNAGNVYVTGNSYRDNSIIMDLVTLKYSSAGVLDWTNIFQGTSAFDKTSSINLDESGNVVVAGQVKRETTEQDYVLIKYGSTIGIQQVSNEVPSKFELEQNYPNPFNPVTNIRFSLTKAGSVKLVVFDVSGKEVSELVNEQLSAGSYNFDFNAANLSSGVYFYKLVASEFTEVKKMILVK
jgi:hypothetical protein